MADMSQPQAPRAAAARAVVVMEAPLLQPPPLQDLQSSCTTLASDFMKKAHTLPINCPDALADQVLCNGDLREPLCCT